MFRQIWLVATAFPVIVCANGPTDIYFTGMGTVNTEGQAAAVACSADIDDNYVTINSNQWNSTQNCGKCVDIVCEDARCTDSAIRVTAFIVDKCTDCQTESLGLSPSVYKTVTGSSDTTPYTIKWQIANCPADAKSFFVNLKARSGTTYEAGMVEAATDSSSNVSILEENDKEVEKMPTTQEQDKSDGANTKSGDDAPGTSTIVVVLVVLVAVCGVALAVVAFIFSAKKKKEWGKKLDDCMTRSFDTFSSPAQTKATIVKI
ncbi:unnamed protein product [Peronospora belbahrii]|uniref:Expansin-like EG45 domain-containing protein n=1 Tax=Peronospora belbahrii TaxID=622444 RepID=A0AAU9KYV3_9STRA|nr:unnamed protein product [Peronospora belbahrii]CAH0513906.1 unnamed protein product [Peronospora belbahrii]